LDISEARPSPFMLLFKSSAVPLLSCALLCLHVSSSTCTGRVPEVLQRALVQDSRQGVCHSSRTALPPSLLVCVVSVVCRVNDATHAGGKRAPPAQDPEEGHVRCLQGQEESGRGGPLWLSNASGEQQPDLLLRVACVVCTFASAFL